MTFFDTPLSGRAFLAAAFGLLLGGMTLVGGGIVAASLSSPAEPAWLVLVPQLVAGVLLVAGGSRVVRGGGRGTLLAGAGLDLTVGGAYVAYAGAVAPELVWLPVVFVVLAATCVALAR